MFFLILQKRRILLVNMLSDYIAYRRLKHNLYVKKQILLSWGITCRIDDALQ